MISTSNNKRKSKITPNFYNVVGVKIKKWVKDNPRIRTQERLAEMLDTSPYTLSRMIRGVQPVSGQIMVKLVEHLGFPNKHFVEWEIFKKETNLPEVLTKDDMIRIIYELQTIIRNQKDMYLDGFDRVSRVAKQNEELIHLLLKKSNEIDRLREELATLKSQVPQ